MYKYVEFIKSANSEYETFRVFQKERKELMKKICKEVRDAHARAMRADFMIVIVSLIRSLQICKDVRDAHAHAMRTDCIIVVVSLPCVYLLVRFIPDMRVRTWIPSLNTYLDTLQCAHHAHK